MKPSSAKKFISNAFNRFFVLISIVIVIVILGAGYILFLNSKVSEITEAGVVDLDAKKEELKERTETLEKLEELRKQYEKLTYSELQQLDLLLPSQAEIPLVIIEIQDFLADNGLTVTSISVAPFASSASDAGAGGAIEQLNITVVVEGLDSYKKVKMFLDAVSTNLPLIELTSFTYSPSMEDYTLNLTTYYQ